MAATARQDVRPTHRTSTSPTAARRTAHRRTSSGGLWTTHSGVHRSGILPGVAPHPSLVETARRLLAGHAAPQELLEAFLDARVYCEAPKRPGVVPARTRDGRDVVCVHSSPAQLAAARGVVPWFSTTGLDLLGQLPPRHHLLLDPASPHSLLLRTDLLRRAVQVQ